MQSDHAVPLARLFAMGLHSLVTKLHERLEEEGFGDVRPAFAFVLLATRESTLTGTDVAALMGMTKQAASKLVDAMEEARYLVRKPHPDDARVKVLHLAPKGRRVLEAAERVYDELESEWAGVLGAGRFLQLRRDLGEVLRALHGGKLPPVRPVW